jgi:hypothetical protein
MKSLLTLFLITLLLGSCKKEEFNTQINISLNSGIRILKTPPTRVLITSYSVDMNKEYKKVIHTLYTDSLGRYSNVIKVKKPSNKEYYKIELEESMWILPNSGPQEFTAGFENNIDFRIIPKWLIQVRLRDSSGLYKPEQLISTHNLSTNYAGILYNIDLFPEFSTQTYAVTAPSDSYITVTLSLRKKLNNQLETRQFKYNTNNSNTIWITI